MTNQSDSEEIIEREIVGHDDTPEVEGHIRKAHTANDIRVASPEEIIFPHNDEDDGPDVEGHIFRV
jgi:hypothetical protein